MRLLKRNDLHVYQERCIQHILNNEGCGLFLDMGLGKTIITLTAIDNLMYDKFEIEKVLVVAPKRVAKDTWMTEVQNWEHVRHLRLSLVLGTAKQRKEALWKDADIYIINRENVSWLVNYYKTFFPFDMIVIDELSSFKNPQSQRFKSLKKVRPKVKRVVGLTGTPNPNGLIDLWSQIWLLDMGERLEKTIGAYRAKYFHAGKRNGYIVYEYLLNEGCDFLIYKKISDICISMTAGDYLELPDKVVRDIPVYLSDKVQAGYYEFEKERVLEFKDDNYVTIVNAAALTTKLLQYAGGAVYDENGDYHIVHDEKLDALEETVESLNGKPVLIFYSFRHELERIKERLKSYKPRELKDSEDISDWNERRIQVLLAHPASAGYGLNLQKGGCNIIWYSITWDLELYLQANARLHRQGQTMPVMIHRLIAKHTYDTRVINAINKKDTGRTALLKAIKELINKYN